MAKIKCKGPCGRELYSPEKYNPSDKKDKFYWQKITWRGPEVYYIRRTKCKECMYLNDESRARARKYKQANKVIIKLRRKLKERL
jgi:hypothetical protein